MDETSDSVQFESPADRRLATLWSAPALRRDPWLRLTVFITASLLLVLLPTSLPLTLLIVVVTVMACARRGARRLLTAGGFVFVLAVALNAFTEPGTVIAGWGGIELTREGVAIGLDRGFRLVALVALSFLAMRAVDPLELADLVSARAGSGARIERAAMTVALALRFVPVVIDEARRLELATRARPGVESRGVLGRVRAMAALFVPLVAGTVRQAEEIAITLDARGYASGPRSSRRTPGRLAPRLAAITVLVVGTAGLFVWASG